MSDNLFFTAALKKYLYPSTKGQITTQDLFDLTLQGLNTTAKTLNAEIKNEEEEDFINERTVQSTDIRNKLEIVKTVIQYKKDLQNANAERKAKAQERQRLLEILDSKEQESLANLSIEEIQKRLAEIS